MATQQYDGTMRAIIGENIRNLRVDSGRSVIDLTKQIDMARGYWYEIERGESNFSIDTLQQIADLFDVSIRTLLTERKSRREPAGSRR